MREGRIIAVARLVFAVLLLLAAVISIDSLVAPERPRIESLRTLRHTLTRFPAHVAAYRRVAELGFELPGRAGLRLWHAAYGRVVSLSPGWPSMRRDFVRQGFFHWPELRETERALVLREAAVLMREPETFHRLHEPLWQLTRDFDYLRQAAPRTPEAWQRLTTLAAREGEFAEYRRMRDDLPRIFVENLRRDAARNPSPDDVFRELLLMDHSSRTRDEMAVFMERLETSPPTGIGQDETRLAEFLEYAIKTRMPRIEALVYVAEPDSRAAAPLRARLALAAGNILLANRIEQSSLTRTPEWTPYIVERSRAYLQSDLPRAIETILLVAPADNRKPEVLAMRAEIAARRGDAATATTIRADLEQQFAAGQLNPGRWAGSCNGVLCHGQATSVVFNTSAAPASVRLVNSYQGEVSPYVEIYDGFERVAEGEVRDARAFEFQLAPGLHDLRIMVINPRDARGERREVKIS